VTHLREIKPDKGNRGGQAILTALTLELGHSGGPVARPDSRS
jgi:hypothetical protein